MHLCDEPLRGTDGPNSHNKQGEVWDRCGNCPGTFHKACLVAHIKGSTCLQDAEGNFQTKLLKVHWSNNDEERDRYIFMTTEE